MEESKEESKPVEPIAIVGMSFKMPQEAVDEPGLWDVLERGKNLMTEWPKNRVAVDAFSKGVHDLPNTVSSSNQPGMSIYLTLGYLSSTC
jgi:acyl transferase domain-containing protein